MNKKILIYKLSCLLIVFVLLSVLVINSNESVETYSQFGSRGEEVKKIQQKLTNEGLFNHAIDGIYGKKTENAVIKYQQKYKLKIDGKAGTETLNHMKIYGAPSMNNNADLMLLARAVSAEARGESYEGQVAVAAVILNRVKHPSFPNTIAGVIYQPQAFSSVIDGQINMEPTASAKKAASDALNGYDPSWGSIYFFNPRKTSNKFMHSRPVIRIIGNHVFAK